MENHAKIKVRVGSMEIEYEGDPSFLADGLHGLLDKMSGLTLEKLPKEKGEPSSKSLEKLPQSPPNNNASSVSTATIAADMKAKTCGELATCALAKLQIVNGSNSASRQDIMREMKTATAYYKQSMRGGNLSQALTALVKAQRLNQLSNDSYSLRAPELQKFEAKIAEIG